TLARARIRVSVLAADRQAAAMPQSAIRAHLDVTLDVQRDFFAQVALDGALFFQDLADAVDFVLTQVADLLIEVDTGPVEQRLGPRTANAVNIRQSDLGSLGGRQIYAGDTCHGSLSLPLFVFRVNANDPHHAFAMDHLAFVTDFLDGSSYFHLSEPIMGRR